MPEDDEGEGQEPEPQGPTAEERLAALEARMAGQTRNETLAQHLPAEVLGTPQGQFFAQHYQGDLTADAVKAEAIRLGMLPDPAAENDQGTATDAERAAHESTLDLRHGGEPPAGELGPHPNEIAREVAVKVRKMGTEDETLGAYIESQCASVARGDKRNAIDLLAGAGAIRGR